MKNFEAQACGKWILCGEHAVLRGHPALVFPLSSKSISLKFSEGEDPFCLQIEGSFGKIYRTLFQIILEKALSDLGKELKDIKGSLELKGFLPVGKGLGASAALCVLLGKWFEHLNWLKKEELYEFCKDLENTFHGESSGLDISAALETQPLFFTKNQKPEVFKPLWKPLWYLSYSGQVGLTSKSVEKVQRLFQEDLSQAQALDEQMKEATEKAKEALCLTYEKGFELLGVALNKARLCFESWGLTEGALKSHMEELHSQGAVAFKPTGSGGGGYVLSLWKKPPYLEGLIAV